MAKNSSHQKKTFFSQLNKLSEWFIASLGTNTSIVIHTLLFAGIFALRFFGIPLEEILLILTTAVSLEAIYLAIFIQMSVNKTTQSLNQVEEEIEDIQEDVEDIQENVDDLQEDVQEISDDYIDDEVEESELATILKNVEKQINSLQEDIAALKKKGLM